MLKVIAYLIAAFVLSGASVLIYELLLATTFPNARIPVFVIAFIIGFVALEIIWRKSQRVR
jgi:Fe2+ transport system protein B